MLEYFWKYETDIPEGLGTPNFGMVHFSWIAAAFLLIVAILLIYRRQSPGTRLRMQKVLVVLIVILQTSQWLWAAIIGHYNVVDMLPLHLCSMTVWVEVAGVFSGRTMFKEFCYALGMPGALASVLTPDWYSYPFVSYQYLQAALGHTLLVLIPVLWVWGDGFRPDYRRLPKLFGLLVLFAIPVALINWLLGSNYLFICQAPKDTPLELFENWFGNPGYLIPLIALIFIIWTILYLPWVIKSRIREKRQAK
jgi:hypothetical integral membrane protein (TIGR02206 family)